MDRVTRKYGVSQIRTLCYDLVMIGLELHDQDLEIHRIEYRIPKSPVPWYFFHGMKEVHADMHVV